MEDDPQIVTGWSVPDRNRGIPKFGFLWWRIPAGWGKEFNQVLLRRARRIIGFQWSDRVFVGVLIGDPTPHPGDHDEQS